MRITVRFFASYRELVGADAVDLDLDEGGTVGDALASLRRRYPVLAEQSYAPLTACNLAHVTGRHELSEGDELAVFPPVSGG